MISCFILDMALVLYIEMSRNAIKTAVGPNPPIMKVHLVFSVAVVVLYVFQMVSGYLRYRRGGMKYHKYTGIAFMVCRVVNLVTSFLIPVTH